MADLNPLVVNPDNIRALNDTIKIAFGGIASIAAAIGTIYTVMSSRHAKIAKCNSEITAVNTEALATHSKDLADFKSAQSKEMDEFKKSVGEMKQEISAELNKIKLVVVKVSNATDQKLGMIPRLQDALESLTRKHLDESFKNSQRDEKLDKFIAGMEKLAKRSG